MQLFEYCCHFHWCMCVDIQTYPCTLRCDSFALKEHFLLSPYLALSTNIWNLRNYILIVLWGLQSSFSGQVNFATGILKENEDSGLGELPRVLQKTLNVGNSAWSTWLLICYTCAHLDLLQQMSCYITFVLQRSNPPLFFCNCSLNLFTALHIKLIAKMSALCWWS